MIGTVCFVAAEVGGEMLWDLSVWNHTNRRKRKRRRRRKARRDFSIKIWACVSWGQRSPRRRASLRSPSWTQRRVIRSRRRGHERTPSWIGQRRRRGGRRGKAGRTSLQIPALKHFSEAKDGRHREVGTANNPRTRSGHVQVRKIHGKCHRIPNTRGFRDV